MRHSLWLALAISLVLPVVPAAAAGEGAVADTRGFMTFHSGSCSGPETVFSSTSTAANTFVKLLMPGHLVPTGGSLSGSLPARNVEIALCAALREHPLTGTGPTCLSWGAVGSGVVDLYDDGKLDLTDVRLWNRPSDTPAAGWGTSPQVVGEATYSSAGNGLGQGSVRFALQLLNGGACIRHPLGSSPEDPFPNGTGEWAFQED